MMLTLYTKNNCSYCMMAKALLKNNDIQFQERNTDTDHEAKAFMVAQGHSTVPQAYLGESLFVEGGYNGLQSLGTAAIKQRLLPIDFSDIGDI